MSTRFILPQLFGDARRVLVLEALLKTYLTERVASGQVTPAWTYITDIAKRAGISTSTAKRVLDALVREGWVEEKPDEYVTPVQNPVKKLRLNDARPAIRELVFFYQKLRGFL